jgi:glutathione S-transferase
MSVAIPKNITLRYFNIPGRGEPSRLALRLAKIPFNDDRIAFGTWKDIKQEVRPWGTLPVLIADGEPVYQSQNIHLYVGSFTGFIPENLRDQLRMRECMFALDDAGAAFGPTNVITDPEKKLEARAALIAPGGKLHDVLTRFEEFLGDRSVVVGDKLSMADLSLFAMLGTLSCGMFDGIPLDLLERFPKLQNYFKKMAARPDIQEAYAAETAPWGQAFRV